MDLLDQADLLLRGRSDTLKPGVPGLWPRAAAFLIRLALEEALTGFWKRSAPGVETCTMRAQLLCLMAYTDVDTARIAAGAWGALCAACHYHSYELAPTFTELRTLHREVTTVATKLSPPV
ncbi:hypothetical protein [Microbispora bryophytorum]|uniref:hypothetical protein n=1 Tax=Microbispora bryophytorum TaxID=1460882 RepID=UPI003710CBAD